MGTMLKDLKTSIPTLRPTEFLSFAIIKSQTGIHGPKSIGLGFQKNLKKKIVKNGSS